VVIEPKRHQSEKSLVKYPQRALNTVELIASTLKISPHRINFAVEYEVVRSSALADLFHIDLGAEVLCRRYLATDRALGRRLADVTSYIPKQLLESNSQLLSADCEPWPGGTQHQLFTVGIELARFSEQINARMPNPLETSAWNLATGVPVLTCRRVAVDVRGRIVEINDSVHPADRTEFRFTTTLQPWSAEVAGRAAQFAAG
jgi:GntR family transcriptional regulator